MKKVWLTIITPTYNAGSCLEKTIQSVKQYKNDSIEYLIIDGGSNDETKKIVEQYEAIVDYFVSERDSGIYDALNKGIKKAHGKYVMMLAAGDRILCGVLEKLQNLIADDTEVFCGSLINHCEKGYIYVESDKDLEKLRLECSLKHPASLFAREMFDYYGYYDINYKCAGDRELFLRWFTLGAKFQINSIPVVLFESGTGISTIDPFQFAIPEDLIISRKYHTPESMIDLYKRRVVKSLFPPRWKKIVLIMLIRLNIYQFLSPLLDNKVVKKTDLRKFGIIP